MKIVALACGLALLCATSAQASPGLGDEVYGATATAGKTELELGLDRLGGGPDHGENVFKVEAMHHVNDRLRVAVFGEFEREPGGPRRAEEAGVEAIYTLGRAAGFDVAVYGEYALGLNGADDAIEGKLIVERRQGPFDLRVNLTAEKPLGAHQLVELGYAAALDYAIGDVRVGVEGFGDLGTFDSFAPAAEHFVGPRVAFEIEGLGPELEVTTGYLFALGRTRDDSKGQARIMLELEF